jgi:TatD DNase family protein
MNDIVPSFIDTHAHLHAEEFDTDREQVLQRARAAGIEQIILIGSSSGWDSAQKALELAERETWLHAAVGIHPNSADTPLDIERLYNLSKHPKVIAIGESGLDTFRSPHLLEQQSIWLRTHIEVARQRNLPIIIHSRDAGSECLKILIDNKAEDVGGVFHCFAESAEFAEMLRDINFLVSFPGILTFKAAENVRETAKAIPIEQILLETDAPYLAPVPYRGKRCESAHMIETARVLAQIKGISLQELSVVTTQNAKKLFRIP